MKLLDVEPQSVIEAGIQEVEDEDFHAISESGQFQFDWTEEKECLLFKIVSLTEETEADQEILGLLSLTDIPEEFRVHINLAEPSNENEGRNKKIDWIAGCLLAFAVQVSFAKGYLGFTSLVPKKELIELYIEKYGFSQYGRQLAIEGKEAIALVQKYL